MQATTANSEGIKRIEEVLTLHFKDVRVLNIWKASIKNLYGRKERLEERIECGATVTFTDSVKSPTLSSASPTNRQPSKGMESVIDKAIATEAQWQDELAAVKINITVTENKIDSLEESTFEISEALKYMGDESFKVVQLRLRDNKSFDEIGEMTNKSKSSIYDFYIKAILYAEEILSHSTLLGM